MRKLFILCLMFLTASCAMASNRRPIAEVGINEFTKETQATLAGSDDSHFAIVWWIPNEYWESVLSRDASTSERDKKALLSSMSGISLLAVVQGDVSPLGAFSFYSKERIESKMIVSHIDVTGKAKTLRPLQTIDPDLEIVLGIFKPILSAAMGNMGNNFQFYVLNDRTKSSERLLDPYRAGRIRVQLTENDDTLMTTEIETPLNALFVPRICPNGKKAHVSWNFCPWSGTPLAD